MQLEPVQGLAFLRIDATENDWPRNDFPVHGFPALYFLKHTKGKPIQYHGNLTHDLVYKFIRHHSSGTPDQFRLAQVRSLSAGPIESLNRCHQSAYLTKPRDSLTFRPIADPTSHLIKPLLTCPPIPIFLYCPPARPLAEQPFDSTARAILQHVDQKGMFSFFRSESTEFAKRVHRYAEGEGRGEG